MTTNAQNIFDSKALEYDQWFEKNRNIYLSELEAIKVFMPGKGKGIEIGVGTGRFASQTGIKYGIDPSGAMSSLARKRGIQVTTGYAEDLPFSDESFDFAIMVTVDCFLNDLKKAYREANRILTKEGRIIIGMLHRDGAIAQKYMNKKESGVYQNANFHTVNETIDVLKACGFSHFNTCQTLFSMNPEGVETPKPGHDQGSFVAIEAIKSA